MLSSFHRNPGELCCDSAMGETMTTQTNAEANCSVREVQLYILHQRHPQDLSLLFSGHGIVSSSAALSMQGSEMKCMCISERR